MSFAPSDLKFATCSDDTTVKTWDFARATAVSVMSGHGGDVKTVDWHPHRALLATGGKDSLVKLWDAKSGQAAATIHAHNNQVSKAKWNPNGNLLATGCRGALVKVFDVRTLKELHTFRGHAREVTSLAWHPHHEQLLTAGGFDGSLLYWLVGQAEAEPAAEVRGGHEAAVWVSRGTRRGTSCARGATITRPSSGAGTGRGRCRATQRRGKDPRR